MYNAHFHPHLIKENFVDKENSRFLCGLASSASSRDWQMLVTKKSLVDCMDIGIGIHPYEAACMEDEAEQNSMMRKLALFLENNPHIDAISEIGLDATRQNLKSQISLFLSQVELANEARLPVVVHCVRQYHEIMKLFKKLPPKFGCIFHGFNASRDIAFWAKEHGYLLSLGTRSIAPGAKTMQYLRDLPLEILLAETDAPFERPHWNDPSRTVTLEDVIRAIAEAKETDTQTVAQQTTKNILQILKMDQNSTQKRIQTS